MHRRAARQQRQALLLIGHRDTLTLLDPVNHFLMQFQRLIQRDGDGLPGAIVVRRPHAASRDDEVESRGKAADHFGEARHDVGDDRDFPDAQPSAVEAVDEERRVFVADLAAQDFIADDDDADAANVWRGAHGTRLQGRRGEAAAGLHGG